jgi:hypothetical protein
MSDLEKMQIAHAWIKAHARPGDDWQVLIDRDKVYLTASAEDDVRQHEISLADLKSILMAAYSGTINRVCVTFPADAQQSGGVDLLVWLTSMEYAPKHGIMDQSLLALVHLARRLQLAFTNQLARLFLSVARLRSRLSGLRRVSSSLHCQSMPMDLRLPWALTIRSPIKSGLIREILARALPLLWC